MNKIRHIVILSEHNLQDTEINNATINNHTIELFYFREIFRGGGLIIVSKDVLSVVQFKNLEIPQIKDLVVEKEFECCVVEGKVGKCLLIIAGMYRTPGVIYGYVFVNKLDIVLGVFYRNYNHVILAGDISIDVLNTTRPCNILQNTLIQHSFQCPVDFPTRVTLESQSAIDNVINRSQLTISGVIIEHSDHDTQLVEIVFPIREQSQPISRLNENLPNKIKIYLPENYKQKRGWMYIKHQ